MNRLKTEFKCVPYDDKLQSDCFKCTVDIASDSLLSVVVERYNREIGNFEFEGINIIVNSLEDCIENRNDTARYEILVVRLRHRENHLEFTDDYKYLCTTKCESINFMVFYKLIE